MFTLDAAVHHHVDAGRREQGGGFPVFDALLHPKSPGLSPQGLVGVG